MQHPMDIARPDFPWARQLRQRIEQTPLAPDLESALQALGQCAAVDEDALLRVAREQQQAWAANGYMAQLGLTEDYLPFAVAVHLYSLELIGANADGSPNRDCSVYKVVNRTMRAPERQDLAAPGGVSADLECPRSLRPARSSWRGAAIDDFRGTEGTREGRSAA